MSQAQITFKGNGIFAEGFIHKLIELDNLSQNPYRFDMETIHSDAAKEHLSKVTNGESKSLTSVIDGYYVPGMEGNDPYFDILVVSFNDTDDILMYIPTREYSVFEGVQNLKSITVDELTDRLFDMMNALFDLKDLSVSDIIKDRLTEELKNPVYFTDAE